MPDVLQVITDDDRRGAQVFALDLHRAMERSGRTVETVALAPGRTGGLEVRTLGIRRISRDSLWALRRDALGARVVFAHGSSTLPACALALLGTRTPFVYRQISDSRFWAADAARRTRVALGLSRARAVVALWPGSAQTVQQYFHVPARKVHVIPNGVDDTGFSPAGETERSEARSSFGIMPNAQVVGFVGALAPEKGPEDAVRAIAALEHAVLLVVGDGPARADLEHLATELAPGRVHFVGSLGEVRRGYAACDVVVLPSRGGDSMPATLIEAGMMGIPTVATPIEGIPTIVDDGATGRITPVGDVDALTRACGQLLADHELRAVMGAAAIEHCRTRFGIDRVAREWTALADHVAPAR